MKNGSEKWMFLALRVKSEVSAHIEIFMAAALGMSYKGLPVCTAADAEIISTDLAPQEIFNILGAPTHYYYGSTDLCWQLDAEKFARFKNESAQRRSPRPNDSQPARGGRLAQLDRPSFSGQWHSSGMLSRHLEIM